MSYSAGIVVWKEENGALSVLIQGKCRVTEFYTGEILNGFPGGSAESGETSPAFTALRELKEETGLKPKQGIDLNPLLVYSRFSGDNHYHYFYLVAFSDLEGKLRTEVIRDNEDILFPPFWMPLSQLSFSLDHPRGLGQLMKTHRGALVNSIRHLRSLYMVA